MKVYIDTEKNNSKNDTTLINGVSFIGRQKQTPNLTSTDWLKKINIEPGTHYRKNSIDKSYQALSGLKNFKKISFEFNPINKQTEKDDLSAEIYLISGNKIAYTIELEASHNPELKKVSLVPFH